MCDGHDIVDHVTLMCSCLLGIAVAAGASLAAQHLLHPSVLLLEVSASVYVTLAVNRIMSVLLSVISDGSSSCNILALCPEIEAHKFLWPGHTSTLLVQHCCCS